MAKAGTKTISDELKRDCFGVLWDDEIAECQMCIVRVPCSVFFKKNNGAIDDTKIRQICVCFSSLFDAKNRYCRVCSVAEKCEQALLLRKLEPKTKKGGKRGRV